MDIIKMINLNTSYGDKKIIKDLSMNIKKNKITAIIGPSGCGKSTLITTLNKILEENKGEYSGTVEFKNEDIKDISKEELRRNIGMLFQKPSPFPMSIYKNLTYAPLYYGVNNKDELKNIVEETLKKVKLYDEVKDDLHMSATKLSGGQQQRLCIARALTVKPEVLVLDEPCSALDIKNTKSIEDMLLDLSKEYTIVIVTHNLSQAKRIADYTAFLIDGELIEYEKTQDLFENPKDERTREYIEEMY